MVSRKAEKKDFGGSCSPLSKGRVYFALFFMLGLSFFVLLRLYSLQVLAHAEYERIADNQHKFRQEILPLRGEVFLSDQEGVFPVAANLELMTAFAVPVEIENENLVASEISRILELDRDEVFAKVSKKGDMYEVLKRKLSEHEAEKIIELNLKGIRLESEQWRYYPGGNLASHIIGFLGYEKYELEGMYGIERHFNDEL